MKKLFEILTGIENYSIPEMHGFIIVEVFLESMEDILSFNPPVNKKTEDGRAYFNTKGFTIALQEGYIPAVECLFINKDLLKDICLEYEAIREKRQIFVTQKFVSRAISEFNSVWNMSKKPIDDSNQNDWREMAYCKVYAMYQLDSLLKMMKNMDLPGEPFDFTKYPDLSMMDRKIEKYLEEIEKLKVDLPDTIDSVFVLKSLRADYLTKIHLFNE